MRSHQGKDWRPERGRRPSEDGEPATRYDACNSTGAPLGYFVECLHGDERTREATYGVFRAHYDEECFFDPVLVRGGFKSEPDAEAEARRLSMLNGLVLELLLSLPQKMTNTEREAHHRTRARRICDTLTRLEQEDEHRQRCQRFADRCQRLLLALARKRIRET